MLDPDRSLQSQDLANLQKEKWHVSTTLKASSTRMPVCHAWRRMKINVRKGMDIESWINPCVHHCRWEETANKWRRLVRSTAKCQTTNVPKSGHVKTKATESDIIIKADRGLFARMNVIAQHRHMNMQDVLKSLFVMVNCNFRRCPCEDIWSLGDGHFDYR